MSPYKLIELAAQISRLKDDDRHFCLGAVGVRKDGVIVASCNGNPKEPDRRHHAEYRLSRKLDRGSTVYVARTLADGSMAMARPCIHCWKALQSKGVERVYWTQPVKYGQLGYVIDYGDPC